MSSTQQKNEWISKSKDRINLLVDKGKKEVIAEFAKRQGKSLNSYIVEAISEKMEKDKGKSE